MAGMRKALCFAALIGGFTNLTIAQQSGTTASAYLGQALDLMQQHSLFKKTIDWPELRKQASAMQPTARKTTGRSKRV